MEAVFQMRKGHRKLGIAMLVFSVLMAAVSSLGVLALLSGLACSCGRLFHSRTIANRS